MKVRADNCTLYLTCIFGFSQGALKSYFSKYGVVTNYYEEGNKGKKKKIRNKKGFLRFQTPDQAKAAFNAGIPRRGKTDKSVRHVIYDDKFVIANYWDDNRAKNANLSKQAKLNRILAAVNNEVVWSRRLHVFNRICLPDKHLIAYFSKLGNIEKMDTSAKHHRGINNMIHFQSVSDAMRAFDAGVLNSQGIRTRHAIFPGRTVVTERVPDKSKKGKQQSIKSQSSESDVSESESETETTRNVPSQGQGAPVKPVQSKTGTTTSVTSEDQSATVKPGQSMTGPNTNMPSQGQSSTAKPAMGIRQQMIDKFQLSIPDILKKNPNWKGEVKGTEYVKPGFNCNVCCKFDRWDLEKGTLSDCRRDHCASQEHRSRDTSGNGGDSETVSGVYCELCEHLFVFEEAQFSDIIGHHCVSLKHQLHMKLYHMKYNMALPKWLQKPPFVSDTNSSQNETSQSSSALAQKSKTKPSTSADTRLPSTLSMVVNTPTIDKESEIDYERRLKISSGIGGHTQAWKGGKNTTGKAVSHEDGFGQERNRTAEQDREYGEGYMDRSQYGGQDREYGDKKSLYGGQEKEYREGYGEESQYGGQDKEYGNKKSQYGGQDRQFVNKIQYGEQDKEYGNESSQYDGQDKWYGNKKSQYGGQDKGYGNTSQYGRQDDFSESYGMESQYGGQDKDYTEEYEDKRSHSGGQDKKYRESYGDESQYGGQDKHYIEQYGNKKGQYGGQDKEYGNKRSHNDGQDVEYGDKRSQYGGKDKDYTEGYGNKRRRYGGQDQEYRESYGEESQYGGHGMQYTEGYGSQDKESGNKSQYVGQDQDYRQDYVEESQYAGQEKEYTEVYGNKKSQYGGQEKEYGNRRSQYGGDDQEYRESYGEQSQYAGQEKDFTEGYGNKRSQYGGQEKEYGTKDVDYRDRYGMGTR